MSEVVFVCIGASGTNSILLIVAPKTVVVKNKRVIRNTFLLLKNILFITLFYSYKPSFVKKLIK
ncbi:MAG TPA: hypothetical protein PLI99_02385 [archaeon]|nr:hypothetical protein [archaeon]